MLDTCLETGCMYQAKHVHHCEGTKSQVTKANYFLLYTADYAFAQAGMTYPFPEKIGESEGEKERERERERERETSSMTEILSKAHHLLEQLCRRAISWEL